VGGFPAARQRNINAREVGDDLALLATIARVKGTKKRCNDMVNSSTETFGLAQKVIWRKEDKLILGARAPSPAMSAKTRNSFSVKRFGVERAAGEGARAPQHQRLISDRSTFWATPNL